VRRTKIICTLGPAAHTAERIGLLIDEGMNVARLNLSHGDHAYHEDLHARVRAQARGRGRAVATLFDLQGPKIRVGRFADGAVELETGSDFTITTESVLGDAARASTTYESLPEDVRPGDTILLDDGMLQLEVDHVVGREVHTRVVIGGRLGNNKGLNLPGVRVSAPALTAKDRQDLALAVRLEADFIALSFVRSPEDVLEARRLATPRDRPRIPIIAKIERPEAVESLADIIDAADGIMVARGDLGVELGAEKVPLVQKRAIEIANDRGRLVIVATQMLESMVQSPRPTRAEASDVANAVLDQADALMLSGETAAGRYPLLAVRTMSRIIEEIESSPLYRTLVKGPTRDQRQSSAAVARAAVVAARQMRAAVIAAVSSSGGAAWLISEHRPEAPIVALTDREDTFRRLAMCWGVHPEMAPPATTTEEMLTGVERLLVERGYAQPGDIAVITLAVPIASGESTNLLKIHRIPLAPQDPGGSPVDPGGTGP
jgi:pyruvate kinase